MEIVDEFGALRRFEWSFAFSVPRLRSLLSQSALCTLNWPCVVTRRCPLKCHTRGHIPARAALIKTFK